jgi:FkbM family methyltransferase
MIELSMTLPDLHKHLKLPSFERIQYEEDNIPSRIYGAADVAAAYCGFRSVPASIRGHWVHGWYPSFRSKFHPDFHLGARTRLDESYWLARKDEEEFFRSSGYQNVAAIGMPLAYLPPGDFTRRPGSLLVMPVHSQDYTTHLWKFDEYADVISAIRDEFSEVLVCVHPSCVRRGYWVNTFKERGFTVVTGADLFDRNALRRVQCLLSSFEYVTTNSFGSHLAYASFFGAKPSIYGPYVSYREEDFKNDGFYAYHSRFLKPALESISEEALRRHRPQFFCHPQEAKADVEWGQIEVGYPNKVSPHEMRRLFGWDIKARARTFLSSNVPGRIKHRARMRTDPSYREMQRLVSLPRNVPTTTTLLGPRIEILDAQRFLQMKQVLFDEELYRFNAEGDTPRILDCGAGIGLSVLYFKRLYPHGMITAFEPDPLVYEVLKRNCDSWGAGDVRLSPKAVWTCDDSYGFRRMSGYPGRLSESTVGDEAIEVQTCRLRSYIEQPVDLLRLNIEGAEIDVLLDCADLLDRVRNLIVDYHSSFGQAQRLDILMSLLTRAGYRMDFRPLSVSLSPLLFRNVRSGIDAKLRILAFRDG